MDYAMAMVETTAINVKMRLITRDVSAIVASTPNFVPPVLPVTNVKWTGVTTMSILEGVVRSILVNVLRISLSNTWNKNWMI